MTEFTERFGSVLAISFVVTMLFILPLLAIEIYGLDRLVAFFVGWFAALLTDAIAGRIKTW